MPRRALDKVLKVNGLCYTKRHMIIRHLGTKTRFLSIPLFLLFVSCANGGEHQALSNHEKALRILREGLSQSSDSSFSANDDYSVRLQKARIEHDLLIATDVTGHGIYLLVEVRDPDGDHLLDPHTGQYFEAPDGSPLSLYESLRFKPNQARIAAEKGLKTPALPGLITSYRFQRLEPDLSTVLGCVVSLDVTSRTSLRQTLPNVNPKTGCDSSIGTNPGILRIGGSEYPVAWEFNVPPTVGSILASLSLKEGSPDDLILISEDYRLEKSDLLKKDSVISFALPPSEHPRKLLISSMPDANIDIGRINWSLK